MAASDIGLEPAGRRARAPAHAPARGARRRPPWRRPWAAPLAAALGAVAAWAVYLRLAQTRAVNSDGASNALQAWDMLHGNLLLRGWRLTDVSFYTTELPQYMLVELVHGLNPDVVHIAAAMTYTLVAVLAAALAKGRATGGEGLVRAALAAGIMLAPQLASGVNILISSPDHIGTAAPVMVLWLLLDRMRPGWRVAVITAALLAWAEVADPLVIYIAALPLVLVSAVRVHRAVLIERQPLRAQGHEAALAAAAAAGTAAAMLALRLISALGGFRVQPVATQFIQSGSLLPRNLGLTAEGLLLLGGADFTGRRLTVSTGFLVLHLAGVMLAGYGVWLAVRRFPRDRDRVIQVLVAGVLVNLTAYVVSTQCHVIASTREIAAVLPLTAALAGRLAARRVMTRAVAPLLLAALAGYVLGLAREVSRPAAPAQNQSLASWLEARRLTDGLSGYWESNVVTLASGGRVRVRVVQEEHGRLAPGQREVKASWYDPARSRADFVVLFPGVAGYPGFTAARAALATFGEPARTYHVGRYTVLVWDKNLLRELR